MKFMAMIYESASDFEKRNSAPDSEYWGSWFSYFEELGKAGVSAGGGALQPPHTSTTLRDNAGQRHVQDGPYADTKEQLGGYFILDVPTLDEALEWAAKCPAYFSGAMEVRPILELGG